jgi:lambda family phage portal protein
VGALDWIARRFGYVRAVPRTVGFAAAEISRLTASLATDTENINNTLRYQLRALRARSRQVTQNTPYGRRFASMVVDNVAGPQPFRLQAKVKSSKGKIDTAANRRIEERWAAWGMPGGCEITGRFSWNTLQRLMVRTLAVDGEVLVRKLRGSSYGPQGFQLQLVDIDRLDDLLNKRLPNGGAIHMGVELSPESKPVAFHLLKRKPASWMAGGYPRETERVPADEILHVFVPEFAEQVRGVPWIYAALLQLVHIGAFAEAAVIAARVGATQMGIIQSPDGQAPLADGRDARGNPQIDAEPGTFPTLPQGYELAEWKPNYPDAAVEPFLKACVRGIAVGVNVAYHNLAGDLEGVNYSSARIGELDERDHWMTLQNHWIEHVNHPLYCHDWLPWQAVSGGLPFDLARLDKYRTVSWQGRRWAWVDPLKEVNAAVTAIDARLKSRTRVIAEGGEDIEDVFDEFAEEQQLATDKGVTLPTGANLPKPSSEDEEEGEEEAGGGQSSKT